MGKNQYNLIIHASVIDGFDKKIIFYHEPEFKLGMPDVKLRYMSGTLPVRLLALTNCKHCVPIFKVLHLSFLEMALSISETS